MEKLFFQGLGSNPKAKEHKKKTAAGNKYNDEYKVPKIEFLKRR